MSYVDNPKKFFSYALPQWQPFLPTPFSTPNGTGQGGNIPAGLSGFTVFDGNFASLLVLPAITAASTPVTVLRQSTAVARVSAAGTNMDENLVLQPSQCAIFFPTATGWKWTDPTANPYEVTYQQGHPTICGKPLNPVAGQRVIVSSDGRATGTVQAEWLYDGTAWLMVGGLGDGATNIVPGAIHYHLNPTAVYERWTSAAQVSVTAAADMGFTAVGTATIGTNASFNTRSILVMSAPIVVASAAGADTNHFTAPTDYIGHEVLVNPSVDNQYFLKLSADRKVCLDVWICNPTTGVPELRLAPISNSSAYSGRHSGPTLSPRDEPGCDNASYEWWSTTVPKSVIDTRKTARGTVRFAIRPTTGNTGNGDPNGFNIAGFGMATLNKKYSVSTSVALLHAVSAGTAMTAGGGPDGLFEANVSAGASLSGIRISIPGVDKDVFLSPSGFDGPSRLCWGQFTIKHSSGDVALGRPSPSVKAPFSVLTLEHVGSGRNVAGWLIPAATLAAKAVTPANSAVSYLEIAIANGNPSSYCSISSIVVEQVN